MAIGDNQYLVRFRPAQEPVLQVARTFCLTHAASLGLDRLQPPLTEQSLASQCQQPVAQYLHDQVQAALRSA